MNPDLMITIAFSLWVVLAWGAWGLLVAHSIRGEKREDSAALGLRSPTGATAGVRQGEVGASALLGK